MFQYPEVHIRHHLHIRFVDYNVWPTVWGMSDDLTQQFYTHILEKSHIHEMHRKNVNRCPYHNSSISNGVHKMLSNSSIGNGFEK